MKRRTIWIALICLIVTSLVLASCTKTTTGTTTSTSITTSIGTTTTTTVSTTTQTITQTTATTSSNGNWWDKLGTPQYGGEMVIRINSDVANFDPYNSTAVNQVLTAWMEPLTTNDWTLDPAVFDYKINYRSPEYIKGALAESWEFPDPNTIIFHLRKGINFQNISPVNGREFTSDDVLYHYDRLFGLGYGFTKANPAQSSNAIYTDLISVTAIDKYTVAFKWKTPSQEFIIETLMSPTSLGCIEAHEAVQLWGDLNDWHHAIGTGPFILQDFVSGSSVTLINNPNYWGYDERHPQNHLPYIDKLKILMISADPTALAGLRTGKIDALEQVSLETARELQKTNPELLYISHPTDDTPTVDPRNDKAPFNDIRVREALQMALDLPTIANTYYLGAADPYPSSLTSRYMTGWAWPYDQWPQDLKDQYAYNPMAAKNLLAAAGYPNGFKTDVVADNSADLNLLQIVQSYFAAVGISMEVRPMEATAMINFVRAGKHDALAYRSSHMLGFEYQPLRQLNRFQTGYAANYLFVSDPIFDAFYPKALAATSVDQVKKVVLDANKYVTQQHFTISLVQNDIFTFYQPWLNGFNGQYGGLTGGASQQEFFLFFYPARFWIDQNLKKSMEH